MRTCRVEGCDSKYYAKGWCQGHYVKLRPQRVCELEDCERPLKSWGMCRLHYTRWRRHGDPHIVLTGGRPATTRECQVPGCTGKHSAHDLCRSHYNLCKYRRLEFSPDAIRDYEIGLALETLKRYEVEGVA